MFSPCVFFLLHILKTFLWNGALPLPRTPCTDKIIMPVFLWCRPSSPCRKQGSVLLNGIPLISENWKTSWLGYCLEKFRQNCKRESSRSFFGISPASLESMSFLDNRPTKVDGLMYGTKTFSLIWRHEMSSGNARPCVWNLGYGRGEMQSMCF